MNFYERRRILQVLSMRPRPRCSVSELISGSVTGRSSSECEIHIDGNMFFWVAGVAGAGLAFLTYQAITMGRRRRRDTGHWPAQGDQVADILWLGRALTLTWISCPIVLKTEILSPHGSTLHVT